MTTNYSEGQTVVVSDEFEADEGVENPMEFTGEITAISTGVNDSRSEPVYTIDVQSGNQVLVSEEYILGFEGEV